MEVNVATVLFIAIPVVLLALGFVAVLTKEKRDQTDKPESKIGDPELQDLPPFHD
ncbi:hypothetical protein [Lujinxingia litoralis]|uniref:hypothetical protein n=1 Tax=Lujinxingia litoralis TaxID=2211119 RepID=UPI001313FF33|nr:hypothetical protein [Lujinxingia litoralis]